MGDITNNISPPTMPNMNSQAASLMSAKIMVIGIIVLFFVLAFCFILSLYAKWYWSRNEDPTVVAWRRNALRSGTQQQSTGARKRQGLDRATLRSIPMLMYDTKDFKEGLECSVCLSEITQGEKVRLLPKCNHGFHVECIDMWFKSHSTCPLCRNSIVSLSRDEESQAATAHAGVVRDSSDSDSNSDSDSDSESHENGSHAAGETISIPTNVLFFGNEVQVRSRGETANEDSATSTSASASTSGVNNQRDELVIEIPRDLCDDCSSSPPPRAEIVEEGSSKTPVVSRLRSLKRLLSRGRMMPSWASGSSSIDIESMENKS